MLSLNWVWIAKLFVGVMDSWKNSVARLDSEIQRHRRIRRRKWANILALRQEQETMLMTMRTIRGNKRVKWEVKRSKVFWEKYCKVLSEEKFKHYFRLSRSSFSTLCVILKQLQKSDTVMRKAISLEKRVAVALYALGSSAEYLNVANLFGIAKSTVCKIVLEFCETAWEALKPRYFNVFPLTPSKIDQYVNEFDAMGFPQCLGALDCCHIQVHGPKKNAYDYRNSKGWSSVALMALVDGRSNFVYINSGTPGRFSDSTVYETSSLKNHLSTCSFLNEMIQEICGVDVPIFVLGDAAFNLAPNLMTPYPCSSANTEEQELFNQMVSKCQQVATDAFAHLKARFRRIGKGIDNKVENAPIILKACCALHNLLNDCDDKVDNKWLIEQQIAETNKPQPTSCTTLKDELPEAERIRWALAEYFGENSRNISEF